MSSRLKSGSRQVVNPLVALTKLHVHVMPTMTEALRLSKRQIWKDYSHKDDSRMEAIGQRPVSGDAARLKSTQLASDKLVEEAIAADPRLARKAQWLRRDEGEHVCCAALACGDDQPFYKRTRTVENEATQAGEPMRIVVSTDDNHVPPGTGAAFIAVTRLVQQFVPIEIWWQGSWLSEDRDKGYVFMVPLVQGDMDYSRLEFCIADDVRDVFSWHVMAAHAVHDTKEIWNGCGHRAQNAYHPTEKNWNGSGKPDYRNSTKFVAHDGITPTGDSVANMAARWLGWEIVYWETLKLTTNASSAEQEIPQERSNEPYKGPSAEDRARWDRQDQEAKARALKEASERMVGV